MEPSELKVVVNLKEDRVVIGVSAPDCDPYLSPGIVLEGGDFETRFRELMAHQQHQVEAALEQWAERKRNPRYVKPKAEARVGATGRASQPQAEATEESPSRTPELPLLGATGQQPGPSPQETETGTGGPGPEPGPQEAPEAPQEPLGDAPEEPDVPEAPTAQEPSPQEAPDKEAPTEAEAPEVEEAPPEAQAAKVERGGWTYYVKATGVGPFQTVHEALLAHGVSQQEIDSHKWWHRWDRLPKKLQDAIERRKVSE